MVPFFLEQDLLRRGNNLPVPRICQSYLLERGSTSSSTFAEHVERHLEEEQCARFFVDGTIDFLSEPSIPLADSTAEIERYVL